jgi:hypothetical protein
MWKMKSQPDARSSFRKLGLVPLLAAAALSHSAAALAQNVPIATAPLRMATPKTATIRSERIRGRPAWIESASSSPSAAGVLAQACPLSTGCLRGAGVLRRPLGTAPDDLQPTRRSLSLDEIDAVVAHLQVRIVGQGKITREECVSYFDDTPSASSDVGLLGGGPNWAIGLTTESGDERRY